MTTTDSNIYLCVPRTELEQISSHRCLRSNFWSLKWLKRLTACGSRSPRIKSHLLHQTIARVFFFIHVHLLPFWETSLHSLRRLGDKNIYLGGILLLATVSCLPLYCMQSLYPNAYCTVSTSVWCYVRRVSNDSRTAENIYPEIVGYDIWSYATLFILPVLNVATFCGVQCKVPPTHTHYTVKNR